MPFVPKYEIMKSALQDLAKTRGADAVAEAIMGMVDQAGTKEALADMLRGSMNESRLISRSQIRRIIAEEISKLY